MATYDDIKPALRKIDVDLIKFFFDAKRHTLEELVDHSVGMFSVQSKLEEVKNKVLGFIKSYRNSNSIFYLFINEEREENLRIVVSTVEGKPNDLTKRFAIILDENIIDVDVKELSLSSKMLILIST